VPAASAVSGGNTSGSLQLPAENVGTTPTARRGPAYLVWVLAAAILAGFGVLYRRFPRRMTV
jgi:amino acid transporter